TEPQSPSVLRFRRVLRPWRRVAHLVEAKNHVIRAPCVDVAFRIHHENEAAIVQRCQHVPALRAVDVGTTTRVERLEVKIPRTSPLEGAVSLNAHLEALPLRLVEILHPLATVLGYEALVLEFLVPRHGGDGCQIEIRKTAIGLFQPVIGVTSLLLDEIPRYGI